MNASEHMQRKISHACNTRGLTSDAQSSSLPFSRGEAQMTLLPVSIELVDQSNPSNCADPRLLTQQEFAHLLELANYAVRSDELNAQDRERAEYMKNNATWD
jgi:hypothetical protein